MSTRKKLKLTLACLVLAPLFTEGVVRVRNYLRHGTTGRLEKYITHEESGLLVPVPGRVVGGVRIDSRGFRSPEFEMPKPEGRIRLAFLGASTTFCAEATDNEATWPHLVCEALREAYPEREFDYVNASVRGYSIEQSLKNLEYRVRELEPDVIIVYHAGADLNVDTLELAVAADLWEPKPEGESWLMRHSTAWFLVDKNLKYMSRAGEPSASDRRLEYDAEELSAGFRARMVELLRACRDVAPLVAVATYSTRMRPTQSDEEARRACGSALFYMPYLTPKGIMEGYSAYNEAIRAAAATLEPEGNVLLIDGEERIPGGARHFVDSVHFTDSGCARNADRVVEALVSSGEIERLPR